MKFKLSMFMLLAAVLFVVACSNESIPEEGSTEDVKELVHEYSVGDIKDETASITSEELIVTNSDEKETILNYS